MLGNKNRMAAHGRLFSVMGGIGWRKACTNKVFAMLPQFLHANLGDIVTVRLRQVKPTAEL